MFTLANLLARTLGGKSHSRVHLVYFALASFDILAVLGGLLLSNQFANVFERTVEYRQSWDRTFSGMWELNDHVLETSAPFVNVFQTGDAVGESKKFEQHLKVLETTIASLQQELIESGKAEAAQDSLAALHVVRTTLQITARHGRLVFSNYYNGWIDEAARSMSMAEQATQKLKYQFHGAMASILVLTRNYENEKTRELHDLKRYEYVIAICILLMVACVTWYGHYIGKLIRQNHREITDGYKRLEDSRADTLMFAARLQTVNEDVTRLNDELAAKMKQLEAAQEESLRKGKLAQLGQLTATVAHEIRNPLNTIRTAVYIMERKLNMRTPELDAQLARINKGVMRCDNIMNELLDFTRTRALQTETVMVDDWLKELVDEQALKLPAMVKVEFRPGLPGVEARFDASRMSRVVINFLTNASEAMVGRGEDPSTFTTSAPTIIISTAQRAGGVEISCSDNGPGIAEEHLQRIREPLFTTKSFGVGLGLPAIDKILDEHGGELRIDTKVGEGTTMTAWLPSQMDKREAA